MRLLRFALVSALMAPGVASAATPYDGRWNVTQNCPSTTQNVQGYNWTYGATVSNGALTAIRAPSGPSDGSIRLSGRIRPDGSALISANGRTGRPEYSVGHVAQGYPVRFSFIARFSPTSGSGTRTQQRSCDFSFSKN